MSDCGVCIGVDSSDGEYPEFSQITMPKARKQHICEECARPIAIGQRYQKCVCKFDGELFDNKTCLQCAEIRSAFSCDGWPMFGELWNEMREFAFPNLTSGCF